MPTARLPGCPGPEPARGRGSRLDSTLYDALSPRRAEGTGKGLQTVPEIKVFGLLLSMSIWKLGHH